MTSHFPIFVDVQTAPPLVIGDSDVLISKIRLLLKIAPVVDVIATTSSAAASGYSALASPGRVHMLDVMTPYDDAVLSMVAGRPLVIIETGDPVRNQVLAMHAKSLGVPVNVPDTISLCSFFLGSIVDRSPVIVAISTSGLAPVLAQHIRARIEDMLAPATGKLAHYLFRLRDRIKHFPHAMRRGLQHQILNGQIAQYILADKLAVADTAIMHMLGDASVPQDQASAVLASVNVVEAGAGSRGLLSLDAADAIRHADSVFYDDLVSSDVLDLARREAKLTFCQIRQHADSRNKASMSMASLIGKLKVASKSADRVIYLTGGDPRQNQSADFIVKALKDHGMACEHITSARVPLGSYQTSSRPTFDTSEIVKLGMTNNRNHNLREGV
ncbi:SAM-dependent methyltransferase [Alphaproteobacteria bacterium]|nr:SAM-dependent methyltransferase [Alphaproteobacteria bacterium]